MSLYIKECTNCNDDDDILFALARFRTEDYIADAGDGTIEIVTPRGIIPADKKSLENARKYKEKLPYHYYSIKHQLYNHEKFSWNSFLYTSEFFDCTYHKSYRIQYNPFTVMSTLTLLYFIVSALITAGVYVDNIMFSIIFYIFAGLLAIVPVIYVILDHNLESISEYFLRRKYGKIKYCNYPIHSTFIKTPETLTKTIVLLHYLDDDTMWKQFNSLYNEYVDKWNSDLNTTSATQDYIQKVFDDKLNIFIDYLKDAVICKKENIKLLQESNLEYFKNSYKSDSL